MYSPYYTHSWAVVIGIDNYEHGNRLEHACNDADAVAEMLVGKLGFLQENVTLLKDGSASKRGIEQAYHAMIERAKGADDRAVVFFAGHGFTREGNHGAIGFLVPVDGVVGDLSTLVRWDSLTRDAELMPAKHVLFIMDACYSGLALQRAVTPGSLRYVADLLQRPCRQVIAAGKKDQTVADGGGVGGRNSLFTGYLLQGIGGAAADELGILTANRLMEYVARNVGQDDRSGQTPHYGNFEGDGDFVLYIENGVLPDQDSLADFLVQPVASTPYVEEQNDSQTTASSLVAKMGYSNPGAAGFGRNDLSARLCEWGDRAYVGKELTASRAFSWLSLIAEPYTSVGDSIDLMGQMDMLKSGQQSGEPWERFFVPYEAITTLNSLVMYETEYAVTETPCWRRYLRITEDGSIEYADTRNAFFEYDGVRYFRYVTVIGLLWQFLGLTKKVLENVGYDYGVRVLFSLVGTKDTVLTGFSDVRDSGGRKWRSPGAHDSYWDRESPPSKCIDRNIQQEYYPTIKTLTEPIMKQIVVDAAKKLGLAYNHQSQPRCFNYGTDEFPWTQYFSGFSH